MNEENYIELSELQSMVREGMESLFPERIWVRAELASVSVKTNGHCYLELCQSGPEGMMAKARGVIWRSRYEALSKYFVSVTGSPLQSGMSVLVRVQVSYSELYGLSFVIDEIEPRFTVGEAEMEKRNTILKLAGDNLIDAQKKLSLPPLPYRLAVISARDAAGFGDFCRHLSENEFGFRFAPALFEATMQGKDAPESIVDALQRIETADVPYDAVLILRGGGSNLDLACFDSYELAFGIATFPIPVFTAIGHDRDYHVADMVAYGHVKTPTALADLFIDCYMAEDERISSFRERLMMAFNSRLSAMSSKVDVLEARIKAADPRVLLSRGYILAADSRGVIIRDAASVKVGDAISVMFKDATLNCEVKEKK